MKRSTTPAMTPAEFRQWMALYGLTHESAAARLGIAKRTIGTYLSGSCAISQVVAMAVWADMHGYPRRASSVHPEEITENDP